MRIALFIALFFFIQPAGLRADDDYVYYKQFLADGSLYWYAIHKTETGKDKIYYNPTNTKGDDKVVASGLTLTSALVDEGAPPSPRPDFHFSAKPPKSWHFGYYYDTRSPRCQLSLPGGHQITSPTETWTAAHQMQFEYRGEKYSVFSAKEEKFGGTYIYRLRDGAYAQINPAYYEQLKSDSVKIEDGMVSINGSPRRLDLQNFDAELKFPMATMSPLLDKANNTIDSHAAVENNMVDLVAAARRRPEDFTEKISREVIDDIASSLRAGRSPVILAPPGRGKTSVIRAFAREVALGNVPGIPRTYRIYTVPPSYFNNDSSVIGITERRALEMVREGQRGATAFFQDELHTLNGQGTHSYQPNSVTQNFLTAMASGELLFMGTDTEDAFDSQFASDPAFKSRFDRVTLPPASPQELEEIVLTALKKANMSAPLELVRYGIRLSEEYDIHADGPRSAVALLKKALGNGAALTREHLEAVAARKFGFPADHFNPKFIRERLRTLETEMKDNVIGQAEAKEAIQAIWERKLSKVGAPDDINSVLLVGPPGTGKTLLAEFSAGHLGYESTRIEMNKFGANDIEAFRREVYKALQKSPFQVLVLDEFEKAPRAVQDAALAMLQDGKFTVREKSGETEVNRHVNAQHALFVLTSNAGGDAVQAKGMTERKLRDLLIEGGISSPIASRIQEVAVVRSPTKDEFVDGVRLYLQKCLDRESEKERWNMKKTFTFTNPEAYLEQVAKEFQPGSDFRDVKRRIRKDVERVIAKAVLAEDFDKRESIALTWMPAANGQAPYATHCNFPGVATH